MNNEVNESNVMAFSFGETNNFSLGDAESVMVNRNILGGFVWSNDKYYVPPHNPKILASLKHASPHHESALNFVIAQVIKDFIPNDILSRVEFRKFISDFRVLGNGYFEGLYSRTGKLLKLRASPAVYTRVGKNDGEFWFVDDKFNETKFQNPICHLKEHDLLQEVYGVPIYMAALQSILLNESATIFRRRYYINGAHAGFIFYLNDATMTNADAEAIKAKIQGSKGVGNFKNLFLHIPGGKPESIKIIPIAEATAKDIFAEIKNVSAKDIMTSHRTPPQLLGQVPETSGGFGDFIRATDGHYANEIEPIQITLSEVNDFFGQEIIKFKERTPLSLLLVQPSNNNQGNN